MNLRLRMASPSGNITTTSLRLFVFSLLVTLSLTARAATYEVKVLLDTDASRSTGCSVGTPAGVVSGVEQILTTTIDVTAGAGKVTGVTKQLCLSGGSSLFGSAQVVDAGGWNVGVTPTGDLVVETHYGNNSLVLPGGAPMRLGFLVSSGTITDAVISDDGGDLLYPQRAGRQRAVTMNPPRVITLDGASTDWDGVGALASGGASSPVLRFGNVSAFSTASDLFFKLVLQANPQAPTAVDDDYTLATASGTLSVAAPGILGNDVSPGGATLTPTVQSGVQHGVLTLNPDGSFTYVNDGTPVSQDQFRYTDSNGTLESNLATVTIALPGGGDYVFTSANNTTFKTSTPGTFTVMVTGHPTPDITETGALPAGVTLVDNGNGTATLAGTPTAQTGGTYAIVLTANKNKPHETSQSFTLTVQQPPGITSANGTVFNAGVPGSFVVTTSGFPVPTVSLTGTLPTGVTFNASTRTLSGTPAAGTGGLYILSLTASNGVTPNATQTFSLTIDESAVITSANQVTFQTGVAGSFTVTTRGWPFPAITKTGALPSGVTLVDHGDGTATLAGTPAAATGGTYPLVLTATNSTGTDMQGFTLTVNQPPAVTSANNVTFTVGQAGTFTATASGFPAPAIAESGALPSGVTYNAATHVLSGTPAAATGGVYNTTFTASNGVGSSTVQNFTLTVNEAPSITSANNVTFQTGVAGTFTVITLGWPRPAITKTGALPSGVTLTDNGNGTATLAGTPAAATAGTYPLTLTATNIVSTSNQPFTLTVNQPPAVTSANNVTFTVGQAGTFTVTAGGFPAPAIAESGALPSGVTYNAATHVLSGTPAAATGGVYNITFTASNGVGSSAVQNFTLTVNEVPSITSANNVTFQTGVAGTFTVTTLGWPRPAITKTGALPSGVTLTDNGNGTATLAGTPAVATGGTYPVTLTATNIVSTSTQPFTLTVNQPPAVTSANNVTFTVGQAGTFTVTASGFPAPGIAESGALPSGVTYNAATHVLSGTPAAATGGVYNITFTASNGVGSSAVQNFTLMVNEAPAMTSVNQTTFTVGDPGTFTATASGFPAPSIAESGALPSGVTYNAATHVLSGTPGPGTAGDYAIAFTATNVVGSSAPQSFTLHVVCQVITLTPVTVPGGTATQSYSQQLSATGGHGAYTFAILSGALPTGVTLSTAGLLSGTPSVTGTFTFVVTATDAFGCVGTSGTYSLVIGCPAITVTNPATNTGVANSAFSQQFTRSGGAGTVTFSTASPLPAGLTLSSAGLLSGTPAVTGTFPIVVTATDANGCTGTGATYTLTIACQTITVTNPATTTGVVNTAFSQTFTASNTLGSVSFSTTSTLPAGLVLSSGGVLSGTPTQTGSFPIVVTATDGNGCTGVGSTYTLVISCQNITVTNPATTTGTANTAFSQTFTASNTIGTVAFTTLSTLPAGLALSNAGVLSGTPAQTGSFPIVVTATDANGCQGAGSTYTLVIACQVITVANPATTTGTANAAFSQQFTQSNAIGTANFSTASTLPAGLTFASSGLLSGTPTQTGSFPIVVTVTDANGCTGTGATYNLTIACQTITVTKPVNAGGTVNVAFSEQFTQSGAIGMATFTVTSGTLPFGLSLSSSGLLGGIPTQSGSFPIAVTATDSNGCTGVSASYNLSIACQVITVGNPATTSSPAGTPLSISFTQSGAVGTATFTTASTLPAGLTLSSAGLLSGTPSGSGAFPIVVTVTDSNGCAGTNPAYTLTITCPTITVTSPGVSSGTAGTAFSQTFTHSGGQGTITWSETGALPSGIGINTTTGVLSGTTNSVGSFPITVTATDQNGCTGTSGTYTLVIGCQTITVTNPGVNTGTVDAAFSQTFTKTGILATVTWSETGALPAGITLNASTGVLSGTPALTGSFPITVTATDTNGCFGSSSYTLTISCQTIIVTNPGVTSGTVDAAFSQTFTQSGAHGTATFSSASTLPAGLSLSSTGVLSGTPTVKGTFPIVVTVTDANNCTGVGATYTLVIACQTITVTNPATTTGTAGVFFSQTFTQSGAHATASFTTASALPSGFSISSAGVLSGTTTAHGSYPIVVTVTDANGCTGTGSTYTLVIACNPIGVTNPVNTTGTVASFFSETFSSSGILSTVSYSTASTLPAGLSLNSSSGVLSGTPTQSGSFPIVVTATDSNGCTGTGATYTLVLACNVITVTNPGVNTGTAGTAFSQTFTQSGGNGTIVWSKTGGLPSGISLNSSTGVLFGTTTQTGAFPITVKATDANGCFGTSSYTLTINCQTITVTNPATNTVQAGTAFDQTFTATGLLGTAGWSVTGTLPAGITLNTSTGHLAGTTTQIGSYPITVTATDTNGCSGTGATYTLAVTCPSITVARTGGGSFPAGIFNSAYTGQSLTATPASTYAFAVTLGSLPAGLSLSAAGAISGTPSAAGSFTFTVTATDSVSLCTGSQSFSIAIAPVAVGDSYPAASHIVDNTQFVITGGSTTPPATTPFVASVTNLITNDLPSGGVTATPGTFATSTGGSVTIASDGTFLYTPKANPAGAAITSDSFTYTVVSNGVTSAAATVNLTLANRVWYVKNNGVGTNGQSQSPFTTLAAAQAASLAGDIIYVYNGDGSTTGQSLGITLKNNQQLIGEGVALVVNTVTLKAAGTESQITNTTATSDVVTLADGNKVSGLTITTATRDGIAGNTHAGFTGDTLTIQTSTNSGLHLTSMTGTVTVTNTTFSGTNGVGLDVNNGTAIITLDATNSITANAGKRSVSIQNRPVSAGLITIGAAITDDGTGILVNNNASGTIAFNGVQMLTTTTNPGVTLTTNTGTTIDFSGTLNITTTTGSAFNATGGGTVSVTATANVTTGAAATGVNLNGVTVGAPGVTFASVNTTGATTGVSLTSLGNGNVTINGGTISGGTTGLSLTTLGTSNITLAGVTLTGSTTAISGTTFGTLTIGASVNVSGVTALNLATGAVSGTFANVTSSGGTNGVNLSAVTGTWGVTAGTLTGAAASTFNTTGTSTGTLSWAGAVTQANAANAVTISGAHTGTINFSGNVQTSGTSTGISISGSSGTYNFTGAANTIAGSGGGVTVSNESGAITFGSGTSITAATTSFKIGGTATNTTANITYSGTITNNNNGGVLLDINSAAGTYSTGTITFNGTSLSGSVAVIGGVRSVINNMTGTLVVNHLSTTSSNTNFANTLVAISGTNTGSTITFNHLTLSANGSAHTGAGLVDSGTGGTVTVTATGGASTIDTGGSALSLNGQNMGASTIGTLTCTAAGTANCVSLTSVSGSLTISGGALNGAGAAAFLVSGGAPVVSCAAAVTQTAASPAVSITGVTGGSTAGAAAPYSIVFTSTIAKNTAAGNAVSVTSNSGGSFGFTGNITASTSTQNAINLATNTGATIDFTGVLTLTTTTGAGFNATGGGTVTVTNAANSVTSAGGAAIDIANTTVGALNIKFLSVSATGGTNGIVLNNTGASGSLVVSGNSGTCQSLASTCTGGTISGTSGHGISLTSTKNPSFNYMMIKNTGLSGIRGTLVTNFSIDHSVIDGVNTSHSADDSNIGFNNTVTGTDNNISGTVSITNCTLNNSYQHGIDLSQYNGTISQLTVTNNSFTSPASGSSFGSAVRIQMLGSGSTGANLTKAVISNNFIRNFPAGDGVIINAGNSAGGPAATAGNSGNATNIINITNNDIQGASAAAYMLNAVAVAVNKSGSGNFNIDSNGTAATPVKFIGGNGVSCGAFGSVTVTCTINNNHFDLFNIANSAGINIGGDQATAAVFNETPQLTANVTANTVTNCDGNGILATMKQTAGLGKFAIQNNVIAAPLHTNPGFTSGIRVDSGVSTGGTDSVCINMSGNTTAGDTTAGGTLAPGIIVRMEHSSGGRTFGINGFTPSSAAASEGEMITFLSNANPNSAVGTAGTKVVSQSAGGTFSNCTYVYP
ncbi:MAG: large repetitive protein [Thermoanaerobaculia bacterium]|jgi:hypothetical protein|nr:large repetitive protein [Thermoanaerobaculia bacterium]